jgi:hypothetical protein
MCDKLFNILFVVFGIMRTCIFTMLSDDRIMAKLRAVPTIKHPPNRVLFFIPLKTEEMPT